jgi:hypothetical protein
MTTTITRRDLTRVAGVYGGSSVLGAGTSGLTTEALAQQAAVPQTLTGIEPNTIKRRGVGFHGYDPDRAFPGFTLFTPLPTTNKTVYLIDMQGSVVHTWNMPYPPGQSGYLTDRGTLRPMQRRRVALRARFVVFDPQMCRTLAVLPSPLWGGVGGGGREMEAQALPNRATPLPSPPPPELGFTRVRHFKVAEVGYIRLRLGREQTEYAARTDSISPEYALSSPQGGSQRWRFV